jgi:hypothetical protein
VESDFTGVKALFFGTEHSPSWSLCHVVSRTELSTGIGYQLMKTIIINPRPPLVVYFELQMVAQIMITQSGKMVKIREQ